jgi:hypothetical protein
VICSSGNEHVAGRHRLILRKTGATQAPTEIHDSLTTMKKVYGGSAMDLDQFVAAKHELEQNLVAAIQAEINKFEEATGRTPIYLDVDMVGMTPEGSTQRKFIVESVRSEVPLE